MIEFPISEIINLRGIEAIYTDAAGERKLINVVDDNFNLDHKAGESQVANVARAVMAQESDVTGADNRCYVEIDGTNYRIVDATPDGIGFMLISLCEY
jgi:hypothetical protein